jgi:hypothetical protein
MRASSIFTFFTLTFVLILFAEAAAKTSLQKNKDKANLEESEVTAEGTEPAQFDSLSIPDLNQRPARSIADSPVATKPRSLYTFFPTAGLYSGPTATQDKAIVVSFGLYFNKLIEDFESIRFGLSLASSTDLFFNISKQFTLGPQTWGKPYWNINMNFAIDSSRALASLFNMRNFTLGAAYGISLHNSWSFEAYVGALSLKGTTVGLNAIYAFSF